MKKVFLALYVALCVLSFSGCVRVAGKAGYWHTDAQGEPQGKQVGFDTANLVSPDKQQGNITV